jgi:hypothetical protein
MVKFATLESGSSVDLLRMDVPPDRSLVRRSLDPKNQRRNRASYTRPPTEFPADHPATWPQIHRSRTRIRSVGMPHARRRKFFLDGGSVHESFSQLARSASDVARAVRQKGPAWSRQGQGEEQ